MYLPSRCTFATGYAIGTFYNLHNLITNTFKSYYYVDKIKQNKDMQAEELWIKWKIVDEILVHIPANPPSYFI